MIQRHEDGQSPATGNASSPSQKGESEMNWSRFWNWLFGNSPQMVPHWTPARAQAYEREMLRRLGRGETHHGWSKKYRPGTRQRAEVLTLAERKRA